MYECGEHWWNDTEKANTEILEKNMSHCQSSTKKRAHGPTWDRTWASTVTGQ